MHPEVIKDKEGKCPKCGMKLMEKKMKMKKMDKKKGYDAGAFRYCTKPFDPDEILELAKDVLGL